MCSDDWGDSGEECARTIRETVEKNVLGRLGRQWEECAWTIRETVEKNVLGRLGRQWRRMCSDEWGDSG